MENENIIPFRSSMVTCERSLFFLTKGMVSGRIDRTARRRGDFRLRMREKRKRGVHVSAGLSRN